MKNRIIRVVTIVVSLIVFIGVGLAIITWTDYGTQQGEVIWYFDSVRFYVLLSMALFLILNIFLRIESLITRNKIPLSKRNLNGLYGYIFGTGIFIIINLVTLDFSVRIICLLIPFIGTLTGFLLREKNITDVALNKKLLSIVNIIALFYWAILLLNLHLMFKERRRMFDDDRTYFERIEKKFMSKSDSLKEELFVLMDRKKIGAVTYVPKKYAYSDSVFEKIVLTQLKLNSEYKLFRNQNPLPDKDNDYFLFLFERMNFMLILGFALILVLNGIYLLYFSKT